MSTFQFDQAGKEEYRDVIEVTGTLEENDYVTAQFLHIRPRPLYKLVGLLVLAAAAWAAWLAFSDRHLDSSDYLFAAALLFLVLYFRLFLPWQARRVFRQQKSLHRELSYSFDETGVSAFNDTGQATIPWEDYLKWKNNDRLLLLYLSDCLYQMIPKRMFDSSDDYNRVLKLVGSRIGRPES